MGSRWPSPSATLEVSRRGARPFFSAAWTLPPSESVVAHVRAGFMGAAAARLVTTLKGDVAPVCEQRAAGHEHREVTGAEERDPSDVVGNSNPTER